MPSAERLLEIIRLQNEIAAEHHDVAGVMQLVIARASTLCNADGGVVEIAEGDDMVYRAASGIVSDSVGVRLKRAASLSGACVTEKKALRSDDTSNDPRVDAAACKRLGIGSMICVPLFHMGDATGAIKVVASRTHAFTEDDADTLSLLAQIIAIAIHNAEQYESAIHRSKHDALTGLLNRRAFEERLAHELQRHVRYKMPLTLAMFDLDGFKNVNDKWGHAAGDEVLRRTACILQASVRSVDACFRLGGDELAVLLPSTTAGRARVVVDRFTNALRAAQLCDGAIDVSFGVAEATDDDAVAFTGRADEALYEEKKRRKRG